MGLHLVQHDSSANGLDPGSVLDGYRDQIIREVDGVALRVGRLLREARESAPERFEQWVVGDLPFGLETARRLMAISAAYEKLPPETLRALPRPWQALYALKELPHSVIEGGIKRGEITPEMSQETAKRWARWARGEGDDSVHIRANETAGRLMRASPDDLRAAVRQSLRDWLG